MLASFIILRWPSPWNASNTKPYESRRWSKFWCRLLRHRHRWNSTLPRAHAKAPAAHLQHGGPSAGNSRWSLWSHAEGPSSITKCVQCFGDLILSILSCVYCTSFDLHCTLDWLIQFLNMQSCLVLLKLYISNLQHVKATPCSAGPKMASCNRIFDSEYSSNSIEVVSSPVKIVIWVCLKIVYP